MTTHNTNNAVSILCPGQGAQAVGMGRDFHAASPAARSIFDQANRVLGFDLQSICFTGPDARLNQTDISQPAIYVAGVASFHAAVEAGHLDRDSITACAGLSLGEYTALHIGGAFDFETGLSLVAARGRLMQQAAESEQRNAEKLRELCGARPQARPPQTIFFLRGSLKGEFVGKCDIAAALLADISLALLVPAFRAAMNQQRVAAGAKLSCGGVGASAFGARVGGAVHGVALKPRAPCRTCAKRQRNSGAAELRR